MTTRSIHLILATVFLVAITFAAPAVAEDEARAAQVEKKLVKAYDPSSETAVQANNRRTFILSAERDKTRVKANVGFRSGDFLFDITASGPIDEKATEAELANLDGLAAGFAAEVGVSYMRWNPDVDVDGQKRICRLYLQERDGAVPDNFSCSDDIFTAGGAINATRAKELKKEFLATVEPKLALLFSARVKANRSKFDFAEPETLAAESVFKEGHAFTLGLGFLTGNDHFFALSYRDETGYRAGASSEICSPLGETGSLQCKNVVLGAPTELDKQVVGLEYRRFVTDSFAVNPKAYFDLENDVESFELPLYFLRDPSGNLIGGFKAGWRSDTDDVTVGAFVGTALRLGGP